MHFNWILAAVGHMLLSNSDLSTDPTAFPRICRSLEPRMQELIRSEPLHHQLRVTHAVRRAEPVPKLLHATR